MSIKVKAAVVTAPRNIDMIDIETPDLGPREALIRVRAVALCTLEQRVFKGVVKLPLPFLGGHEVAGEIASLGSAANPKVWSVGERVSVRLLYNCGECHYCRKGKTNMCVQALKKPTREGFPPGPGGLCDYIIVETPALYKITDALTFEEASLTEPLACCIHSIERGHIHLSDDVVIIGGGIMGQFHILLAKMQGARVILSEVDEARRALGINMGADIVFNPMETDPVAFVKGLTDGRGADVVFNTTAIGSVMEQAIAMCGKNGRMIQYSSVHPDAPSPLSPQLLHSSEIILSGSISPDSRDYHTANRLLSLGLVDAKPLIQARFPFAEVQQALEMAIQPGTLRVIVTN